MVKLRVSEAELVSYKARAVEQGLSLSDWIRSRLDSTVVPPAVFSPLVDSKLIVDVSPVAPLSAGSPEIAGTPSTRLFESEKPRAGRRTLMCAHRVPVGSYCSRCD